MTTKRTDLIETPFTHENSAYVDPSIYAQRLSDSLSDIDIDGFIEHIAEQSLPSPTAQLVLALREGVGYGATSAMEEAGSIVRTLDTALRETFAELRDALMQSHDPALVIQSVIRGEGIIRSMYNKMHETHNAATRGYLTEATGIDVDRLLEIRESLGEDEKRLLAYRLIQQQSVSFMGWLALGLYKDTLECKCSMCLAEYAQTKDAAKIIHDFEAVSSDDSRETQVIAFFDAQLAVIDEKLKEALVPIIPALDADGAKTSADNLLKSIISRKT